VRRFFALALLCCGCSAARQAGEHPGLTAGIVGVTIPMFAAIPFRLCGWHRWFESPTTK
jgi:hypothetical protein